MNLNTEKIFNSVDENLIKNAKVEIEVANIINEQGFFNSRTEKVDYDACFDFFERKHKEDITIYKLRKASGYDVIALYKGVAMIGIADFSTRRGKAMENGFSEVEDWPTYQSLALKRKVLCNLIKDPFDRRTGNEFKPTANKLWQLIEKCLMA